MNILEQPYAKWLEGTIRELTKHEVKSIALAAIVGGEQVLTGYYEASFSDKAIMAAFIQGDAMLDMAVSNAQLIVDAAEEDEEANGD